MLSELAGLQKLFWNLTTIIFFHPRYPQVLIVSERTRLVLSEKHNFNKAYPSIVCTPLSAEGGGGVVSAAKFEKRGGVGGR